MLQQCLCLMRALLTAGGVLPSPKRTILTDDTLENLGEDETLQEV